MKFSEIKKLIDFCAKKGVSEITLGDFKVVFALPTKEALTPTALPTKENEVQTQQVETEALRDSSKELDQEDLAVMSIEDPVRYEQMLIEGELEDDGSGDDINNAEQRAIDSALTTREPSATTRERVQTSQH